MRSSVLDFSDRSRYHDDHHDEIHLYAFRMFYRHQYFSSSELAEPKFHLDLLDELLELCNTMHVVVINDLRLRASNFHRHHPNGIIRLDSASINA